MRIYIRWGRFCITTQEICKNLLFMRTPALKCNFKNILKIQKTKKIKKGNTKFGRSFNSYFCFFSRLSCKNETKRILKFWKNIQVCWLIKNGNREERKYEICVVIKHIRNHHRPLFFFLPLLHKNITREVLFKLSLTSSNFYNPRFKLYTEDIIYLNERLNLRTV